MLIMVYIPSSLNDLRSVMFRKRLEFFAIHTFSDQEYKPQMAMSIAELLPK